MEHSQTDRVKKRYHQLDEVETLLWTFGISNIVCYCIDYGYKLRTSFEPVVSKNTATLAISTDTATSSATSTNS